MNPLIALYRRLDLVQQKMWFRIAATVLVLAACGGFFGYLLVKSYSLQSQRISISSALNNQNFDRGDEHAISLRNTGIVHVNGRDYGGPEYMQPRLPLFDQEGNLIRIPLLIESFLSDQRPEWVPAWLLDEPSSTWLVATGCIAWLLLVVWMGLTFPFIITLLATAIPVSVGVWLDKPQLTLGFGAIGLLTFTFVLLTRVGLVALNQAWQIPAVAHTAMKEASRRGIALVFIVLLLVVLPLLPLLLDAGSPLRFRIQSYISWSMGLTFTIAAVMTLFFSCASVAFEIRDRQIWQLVTKPLARLNYLLGKWVGIMTINLIILTVAGLCTFAFIRYLEGLPVDTSTEAGQYDLLAVRDEILSARVGAAPTLQMLDPEIVRQRVNQIIENDPELSRLDRVPVAQRNALEQRLQGEFMAGQRSIPPGGYREYLFRGLDEARQFTSSLMVRYKFYILRDDEHTTFNAAFYFNDDPRTEYISRFVPSISHSFPIPASYVREDGTLKLTIVNPNTVEAGGGAMNWEPGAMEVLYKAGNFQGNFVRAMLTIWIKLAFLAALGICCATFLNFPVACLLSFTVFISGVMGPYLAQSLEWWEPVGIDQVDWAQIGPVIQWSFEWFIASIAYAVVFLLSSFGEYKPTQQLVEGRLIEWSSVFYGFLKLAVLWSGLAMLVGYGVLRKRQLAIYSGQG